MPRALSATGSDPTTSATPLVLANGKISEASINTFTLTTIRSIQGCGARAGRGHGRRVVMNHAPLVAVALEQVGGLRERVAPKFFSRHGDILDACDPGEIALDVNGHLGGQHVHCAARHDVQP